MIDNRSCRRFKISRDAVPLSYFRAIDDCVQTYSGAGMPQPTIISAFLIIQKNKYLPSPNEIALDRTPDRRSKLCLYQRQLRDHSSF